MTFILGWVGPTSAWLATDTRHWSLNTGMFDGAESKLKQIEEGWAAQTGLRKWADLAFDAIRDIPLRETSAVVSAIAGIRTVDAFRAVLADPGIARSLAHLRSITTAQGGDMSDIGALALVYRTPATGYRGLVIDDAGTLTTIRAGAFFCMTPPGLSTAAIFKHLEYGRPAPDYAGAVRCAAETVQWAAARSEWMSNALELVYLTPGSHRHIGPTRVADFLTTAEVA